MTAKGRGAGIGPAQRRTSGAQWLRRYGFKARPVSVHDQDSLALQPRLVAHLLSCGPVAVSLAAVSR